MNVLAIIPLFLGNLRGWQLIILLLVILVLFGGKKIPELMRNMGKGIAGFKQGLEEAKAEINKAAETKDKTSDSASAKKEGE